MELKLKKTTELTIKEKEQICELFLEIFEKSKSIEDFDRQFLNTVFGYSYHGILYSDDNIVGINTIIPYAYNYFGKEITIALSVDTMTKKEFRSISIFKKLAKLVYDKAREENVSFVLGFPNDVSYKIFKKMLRWKDIDKLNFYFLPIKIANIKKSIKILNFFNILFVKLLSFFTKFIPSNDSKISRNIEKINCEQFRKQRYTKEHKIKKIDNFNFVYKFDDYEDTKVIYLIDVFPLSKKNVEKSVNFLINNYSNKIDGILYLGNLDIITLNMIKIPRKYEPKNVYVSGLILNDSVVDERVWDIKNWNLNLSNMDVL